MTNRRSLRTSMHRISRAQQFVPGHVGGRVASAQPVRERQKVGAISRIPGLPPEQVTTWGADFEGSSITAPAFPVGMTSAVALVGATGRNGYTTPSGWRSIASGSHQNIEQYELLAIDSPTGSESRVFSFPNVTSGWGVIGLSVAYYTGGGSGTWSSAGFDSEINHTNAYMVGVPVDAVAYFQAGIITGVYAWNDKGGTTAGQGPGATYYYHPTVGTSGMPGTPRPSGTTVDWTNIGAYGPYNSVSFAAVWSA